MHLGQWSAYRWRHRAVQKRWAAEHRNWEQYYWSQVLFSEESRFSLECDTRRVLVCREMRVTQNNPIFVRGWYKIQTRCLYGIRWNQHSWTHGSAYHSKWYFDGPKVWRRDTEASFRTLYCSQWLPLFPSMIMPDHMQLIFWRLCLKLKQWSVWNGQCVLLTWIQLSMFGTCSDDALHRDQGLLLPSEIWILHFLRRGTVFPKVLSITSWHPWKTFMQQS